MHLAHDVTMSILGAHVEAIHLFLHLKPYLLPGFAVRHSLPRGVGARERTSSARPSVVKALIRSLRKEA